MYIFPRGVDWISKWMASYYLVLFATGVFAEDFKLTDDLCGDKHDSVGWNFCVVDNLLS